MSWPTIDTSTPAGNSAKKFGDDYIRELKQQIIQALQVISGYPNIQAGRDAVWTTASRPSTNLSAGISGYNTTLGYREFWNGTSWLPSNPFLTHTHTGEQVTSAVDNATNADKLDGYEAAAFVLKSRIVASLNGDAGQVKIPVTDDLQFIVKWGISFSLGDLSGDTYQSVTFPEAFPNYCSVVIPVLYSSSNGLAAMVSAKSASGFTILLSEWQGWSQNARFSWIAIGY